MTDKNTTSRGTQGSGIPAPIIGLDAQLYSVRKSIKNVSDKSKHFTKKTTKNVKQSSSKKSLESIDFSYSKKLRALSNTVKKQKALSQFDDMEEHIVKSGITMKKTTFELSELSKLISEFKQKQVPANVATSLRSKSKNGSTKKALTKKIKKK